MGAHRRATSSRISGARPPGGRLQRQKGGAFEGGEARAERERGLAPSLSPLSCLLLLLLRLLGTADTNAIDRRFSPGADDDRLAGSHGADGCGVLSGIFRGGARGDKKTGKREGGELKRETEGQKKLAPQLCRVLAAKASLLRTIVPRVRLMAGRGC